MNDLKVRQEELKSELKRLGSYFEEQREHLINSEKRLEEVESKFDKLGEDIAKSDEVSIPEGFTRNAGNECPVPDGVEGEVIWNGGILSPCTHNLHCRVWNELSSIEFYRVTHVNTLTLDDVKEGYKYWYINSRGEVDYCENFRTTFDYSIIGNNMAYGSEELCQCAIDHKTFNSPVYDNMFS